MNKAILVGNLCADPELRTTQSGQSVLNMRVATSERRKQQDGTWADHAEYHSVVFWGKRAEGLATFLGKGRAVAVEGKIQTRKWQDKDGNDRYSTEVVAWDVEPVGRGDQQPRGGSKARAEAGDGFEGGFGDESDSLPF